MNMNIPKGQKRIIGKRARVIQECEEEPEEPACDGDAPPQNVIIEAWDRLFMLSALERIHSYSACIHSVLTHVLFSLSMIPSPYLTLRREMSILQEVKGIKQMKLVAFMAQLDNILDLIVSVLSVYCIKRVSIGFGASAHNLKYVINLHIQPSPASTQQPPTSTAFRLDSLKRLCMQKLVEYEGSHPNPHLPPTGSVFLMFEINASQESPTLPSNLSNTYRIERGYQLTVRGGGRKNKGKGVVEVLSPSLVPLPPVDVSAPSTWLLPIQGIKFRKYTA